MGHTILPYSHLIESEKNRFKSLRKALSKENQEAFDRLFDHAKFHNHAGVYQAHPWPMHTSFLSILLENEKLIEEAQGRKGKTWVE